MNSFLNKSRYGLFIAGLLPVLFVFSGCPMDDLFHGEPNLFIPSGKSFIILDENHTCVGTPKDTGESITSLFPSVNCYFYIGNDVRFYIQRESLLNPQSMAENVSPCSPVVRNQDIKSLATQPIYQKIPRTSSDKRYYSFDLFDCHFIVLDTEIPGQRRGISGKQLAWLRIDLKNHAYSTKYLFVFAYHPLHSHGNYQEEKFAHTDELHRLFTKYGVDIVFSGYGHKYYIHQKDSVHYVWAGGKAPNHMRGKDADSNHYLLIEILHPDNILVHKLDALGRLVQTDIVPVNYRSQLATGK